MVISQAGGVGLAALLLNPYRLWPAILATLFVAGTAVDLLSGRPFHASVGFMIASVVESAACAWLVSRYSRRDMRFARVREVLLLIVGAIFVNACTALIGAGTAASREAAPFWGFWLTWWIAHGLGILLIAPWIVTWAYLPKSRLAGVRWIRVLELSALMAISFAASWLLLYSDLRLNFINVAPYMFIALLTWAILRFGQPGVTMALVVMAIIVAASAVISIGPSLGAETTPQSAC